MQGAFPPNETAETSPYMEFDMASQGASVGSFLFTTTVGSKFFKQTFSDVSELRADSTLSIPLHIFRLYCPSKEPVTLHKSFSPPPPPPPSPHLTPVLATSGIDYDVKLWEPTAEQPSSLLNVDEVGSGRHYLVYLCTFNSPPLCLPTAPP